MGSDSKFLLSSCRRLKRRRSRVSMGTTSARLSITASISPCTRDGVISSV
jgi:hypothetical protein